MCVVVGGVCVCVCGSGRCACVCVVVGGVRVCVWWWEVCVCVCVVVGATTHSFTVLIKSTNTSKLNIIAYIPQMKT